MIGFDQAAQSFQPRGRSKIDRRDDVFIDTLPADIHIRIHAVCDKTLAGFAVEVAAAVVQTAAFAIRFRPGTALGALVGPAKLR